MNEIGVLWQESSRVSVNIPDTLIIKDKEIKDWLYTSSVNPTQKGQLMKHKRQTVTISKILEVFLSTESPEIATYLSESKSSTLTKPEFELLLLSISDSSCESSFIIQKFLNPDFQIISKANFITESITILIPPPDPIPELYSQSQQVLQFLSFACKDLFSGEFFWTISGRTPYLYKVLLQKKPEQKIRCSSARSHQLPSKPNIVRRLPRPVTASYRRDSLSSVRTQTVFKKKNCDCEVQTDEIEDCKCREEYEKLMEELRLVLEENQELEEEIEKVVSDGKDCRRKVEEKWKERSLEITKVLSDKFFE